MLLLAILLQLTAVSAVAAIVCLIRM